MLVVILILLSVRIPKKPNRQKHTHTLPPKKKQKTKKTPTHPERPNQTNKTTKNPPHYRCGSYIFLCVLWVRLKPLSYKTLIGASLSPCSDLYCCATFTQKEAERGFAWGQTEASRLFAGKEAVSYGKPKHPEIGPGSQAPASVQPAPLCDWAGVLQIRISLSLKSEK